MILIDTNVISEPLRPRPDPLVINWLRALPLGSGFLSAVSMAELLRGIAQLPDGKRKEGMADDAEATLARLFAGRILPFEHSCARAYAQVCSEMRKNGRAISALDAQIAATARVHHFIVATRDIQPFKDAGLEVANPWADE